MGVHHRRRHRTQRPTQPPPVGAQQKKASQALFRHAVNRYLAVLLLCNLSDGWAAAQHVHFDAWQRGQVLRQGCHHRLDAAHDARGVGRIQAQHSHATGRRGRLAAIRPGRLHVRPRHRRLL